MSDETTARVMDYLSVHGPAEFHDLQAEVGYNVEVWDLDRMPGVRSRGAWFFVEDEDPADGEDQSRRALARHTGDDLVLIDSAGDKMFTVGRALYMVVHVDDEDSTVESMLRDRFEAFTDEAPGEYASYLSFELWERDQDTGLAQFSSDGNEWCEEDPVSGEMFIIIKL